MGNFYDECWIDKQRSPDTSENFAMKIENFNKKEKSKVRQIKDKSTKITKTIININIPNANLKKNTCSNISIPKHPTKGNILNKKIVGDSNKVPFQSGINSPCDLDDDTNEGIPIENNNLISLPFKSLSVNNNNLSDIDSKNMRLNTEDNYHIKNHVIYNNLLINPLMDKNGPAYNNNNLNSIYLYNFLGFAYGQINQEDKKMINSNNHNTQQINA